MANSSYANASSKGSKLMSTKMHLNGASGIAPPPGVWIQGVSQLSIPTRMHDEAEQTAGLSSSESEAPEDGNSWEAHLRGECNPCAYFWAQEDGCRRGDDCTFCHEYHVPVRQKSKKWDAFKKWKKAKRQKAKAAAEEAKAQSLKVDLEDDYYRRTGGCFEDGEPASVGQRSSREESYFKKGEPASIAPRGSDFRMGEPARVEISKSKTRDEDAKVARAEPSSPHEVVCYNGMVVDMPSPKGECRDTVSAAIVAPDVPLMPSLEGKPPQGSVQRTTLSEQGKPHVPADAVKAHTTIDLDFPIYALPAALRADLAPHGADDQVSDSCIESLFSTAANEQFWSHQSMHKTPTDDIRIR